MDKQEKIVCAAFRFVFSCCEEIVLTTDYEMKGHALHLYGQEHLTGFFKGFITNKNRFVDPKEAMQIAFEAKQIAYLNDIYEKYTNSVIGNRGLNEEANRLFLLWRHQCEIFMGIELKPEDLH